jgi:hypothetical protein
VVLAHMHTRHLNQIHHLYPSLSSPYPLLQTISTGFKVPFSHLRVKCFDRIHLSPSPSPFDVPHLLVCTPNRSALHSYYSFLRTRFYMIFVFHSLVISLSTVISMPSPPFSCKQHFIPLYAQILLHCILSIPHFLYAFIA